MLACADHCMTLLNGSLLSSSITGAISLPVLGVSVIGDGGGRAVQLGQRNGELLVVGAGVVLQVAECDRFAELDGCVGVAAPVNPGVDAVTEADVAREF